MAGTAGQGNLIQGTPMRACMGYFAGLNARKQVLWCYLIWYLTTVYFRFDPSPSLWVNSLGISLIIGTGLVLSVAKPAGQKIDRWQTFRLFLIPFCVSSFSALIKGHGYVFVFSSEPMELMKSTAACAAFLLATYALRKTLGKPAG